MPVKKSFDTLFQLSLAFIILRKLLRCLIQIVAKLSDCTS